MEPEINIQGSYIKCNEIAHKFLDKNEQLLNVKAKI